MPNKLKQKFSFLFKWKVWKIVYDFHLPLIAVEIRDTETRQVQIVVINYQNSTEFPSNSLNIEWWSTLAGISKGCFVIQNFKDSKFPEPKGFILYNALKQKLVSEDNDSAFAFFTESQVISTKVFFDKIVYQSYDIDTGKKEEISPESLKNLTPEEAKISLPLQYNEGNNHFTTIKRYIKNCKNKDAIKAVEYLETESIIMVSYYIRALEKLENFLLITDLEGKVIEDFLIGSHLDGISKETFFVKDNHLYFVKNKKELQSYEL